MAAFGEAAVLGCGGLQPALDLAPQIVRFHHRVDDVLGGEVGDVYVPLVLESFFSYESLPVLRVVEGSLRGYNDLKGGSEELERIMVRGRQRNGGFSRERIRGV